MVFYINGCTLYYFLEYRHLLEKETQKGKMKITKVQKSKRCENVKSNSRFWIYYAVCTHISMRKGGEIWPY